MGTGSTARRREPDTDRLKPITLAVPPRLLHELEQASRRRGVPLDQLVITALYVAATY